MISKRAICVILMSCGMHGSVAATHFEKCLESASFRNECIFAFSRNPDTDIYHEASTDSPVRWKAHQGQALRIDWRRTRKGIERGWAYVDNGAPGEYGWVAQKNIAGYGDFRRLDSCWPIVTMRDDDERIGDFFISAEFSADGRGRLTSEGNRRVQVWYTPNLILIGRKPDVNAYVYGYNSKLKSLTNGSQGYTLKDVTLRLLDKECMNGVLYRK